MLKMILDQETFDALDASLQSEYTERDGQFVLQVDGVFSPIDRNKLNEALRKEREDHGKAKAALKKFGTRSPDAIDALETQVADLQAQLDTTGGDPKERQANVDKLVETRLAARIKPLERQIAELGTQLGERDQTIQSLNADRARGSVVGALRSPEFVKSMGLNPDVQDDAFDLWALHNFTVDPDGRVVTSDAFGTPGLAPADAFKELKAENKKRHWFGETAGGGANGGRGKESFTGANPFAQGTYNLTKAAQIVRDNPQLAVRMAKAATTDKWNAMQYLPKELL